MGAVLISISQLLSLNYIYIYRLALFVIKLFLFLFGSDTVSTFRNYFCLILTGTPLWQLWPEVCRFRKVDHMDVPLPEGVNVETSVFGLLAYGGSIAYLLTALQRVVLKMRRLRRCG